MDLPTILPVASAKRTYSDAFSEEELPIDPALPLTEKLKEFANRHFSELLCLWTHIDNTSRLPERLETDERLKFIQRFSELTGITTDEEKNSLLKLIGLDLQTIRILQAITASIEPADKDLQTMDLCLYIDANPEAKEMFHAIFAHRNGLITLNLDQPVRLTITETVKLAHESGYFNTLFTNTNYNEGAQNTIAIQELTKTELYDMLACINDPDNHSLSHELDPRHPIFHYRCERLSDKVLTNFSTSLFPMTAADNQEFESYLPLLECEEKGKEILREYFLQSIMVASDAPQLDELLTTASQSTLISTKQGESPLVVKFPLWADDSWIEVFLKHEKLTALDVSQCLEISHKGRALLSRATQLIHLNLKGQEDFSPGILAKICQNLKHLKKINVDVKADSLSQLNLIKDLPIKELDLKVDQGDCSLEVLHNLTPFFTSLDNLSVSVSGKLTRRGLSALINARSLSSCFNVDDEVHSLLGKMSQLKSLSLRSPYFSLLRPTFRLALQQLSNLESLSFDGIYDDVIIRHNVFDNKPHLKRLEFHEAAPKEITTIIPSMINLKSLKELHLFLNGGEYSDYTFLLQQLKPLPILTSLYHFADLNDALVEILRASQPNLRILHAKDLWLGNKDLTRACFAGLAQLPHLEQLMLRYDGCEKEDEFPADFLVEGGEFHLNLTELMRSTSLKFVAIDFRNFSVDSQQEETLLNPYANLKGHFHLVLFHSQY